MKAKQLQWTQEKPGRWAAASMISDGEDPMQWVIATVRKDGFERYQLDHDSWAGDDSDDEDFASIAQAKAAAQRHEERMVADGEAEESDGVAAEEPGGAANRAGLAVVDPPAARLTRRSVLAWLAPHLSVLPRGKALRVELDRIASTVNMATQIKPLERAIGRTIDYTRDPEAWYFVVVGHGEKPRYRRGPRARRGGGEA